jgi:hypothetical protein
MSAAWKRIAWTLLIVAIAIVICVCVLVGVLIHGLQPHADEVPESKMIRDFFHLPMDAQRADFKSHTLEEQYELYVWGMEAIHPPELDLATLFAENGPTLVPFLKTKLKATRSDRNIALIAMAFNELARLELYDFSSNPESLDLLEQRARAIKGIQGMNSKRRALEDIAEIRAKCRGKQSVADPSRDKGAHVNGTDARAGKHE